MLLPRPYDDELVGSVLARGIVYTGLPTKRFLRTLTGRRTSTLSFFLPADLRAIASAMGADLSHVLWQHTAFPYVTAFMPPQEVTRLETKASQLAGTREESLSSLVKSVTRGLKALRFCSKCCAQELATLGESYWHRSHNLPLVQVCHRHDVRLTDVPTPSMTRAFEIGLPHHQRRAPTTCASESETLRELAARSAELLAQRGGCDEDLVKKYRNQAHRVGYILASGDSAGVQLSRDLRARFGDRLLKEAGCEVALDSRGPWPSLMLRTAQGVPFMPVKHVLLCCFLDNVPVGEKEFDYCRPGKQTRDYGSLDKRLASHMRTAMIRAQARNVRMTVESLVAKSGLWSSFRHHRELFPESRAALAEFRKSNVAERQEGRRPYWRKRLGLDKAASQTSQ
jgi:hypothetical protein